MVAAGLANGLSNIELQLVTNYSIRRFVESVEFYLYALYSTWKEIWRKKRWQSLRRNYSLSRSVVIVFPGHLECFHRDGNPKPFSPSRSHRPWSTISISVFSMGVFVSSIFSTSLSGTRQKRGTSFCRQCGRIIESRTEGSRNSIIFFEFPP